MAKSRLKGPKRIKKSKKSHRKIVFDTLKENLVVEGVIASTCRMSTKGFIKQFKTDPEFAKKWANKKVAPCVTN